MSKEALKNMIDLIPDSDIETLYNVIIKFIPETEALDDEKESIKQAGKGETIKHSSINWD